MSQNHTPFSKNICCVFQWLRATGGGAPWYPSHPCPTTLTWRHQNLKTNSTGQSCLSPRWQGEESEGAYLLTPHAATLAALSSHPTLDKPLFSPRRFGVRPLPKRQMILKLKEIHQYTHQLVSSDSEDEACPVSHSAQIKPSSVSNGNRQHSCTQPQKVKAPSIASSTPPLKHSSEEQIELLSASQGSNTSSTAASEESKR